MALFLRRLGPPRARLRAEAMAVEKIADSYAAIRMLRLFVLETA